MNSRLTDGLFARTLTCLHYALIRLRRGWLTLRFPPAAVTDSRVQEVVSHLTQYGWAVLTNYIPEKACKEITEFIDQLITSANPILREEYAGAEYRCFGAEELAPNIAGFHDDDFLHAVAEQYLGTQVVNICTMANKSLPAISRDNVIGRWHRDSFGRQIKAIGYLVEVDEFNGAFEYLPGSNKLSRILSDIRSADLNAFQWRISDAKVQVMCGTSGVAGAKFLAPAGSVIFVDTSIIHRASPVENRSRYALTNYYIERGRYRKEVCDALGVAYRSARV